MHAVKLLFLSIASLSLSLSLSLSPLFITNQRVDTISALNQTFCPLQGSSSLFVSPSPFSIRWNGFQALKAADAGGRAELGF